MSFFHGISLQTLKYIKPGSYQLESPDMTLQNFIAIPVFEVMFWMLYYTKSSMDDQQKMHIYYSLLDKN